MCGVAGMFGVEGAFNAIFDLLYMQQHRGDEGTGVVFGDGDSFIEPAPHRTLGIAWNCKKEWPGKEPKKVRVSVGHGRYGTAGDHSLTSTVNLQPFVLKTQHGTFCIGHNGDTPNFELKRKKLEVQGAVFTTSSDTETIALEIARQPAGNLKEAIQKALPQVESAFALVLATPKALIGCRDPWGYRPLSLGRKGDGWVLVSETCALDVIQAEFVRDIEPGEMVWIDEGGVESLRFGKPSADLQQCVFELIYFSRPDCRTFGRNVDEFREAMGRQLAEEYGKPADEDLIIVGIPDSGTIIANGYAEAIGMRTEPAIIRHHFAARTFIQPGEEARANGVRLKFNPIRHRIQGKAVVLVDDSLVRGNTMRRLARMVKRAGARKVIVLIASPPICYPCRYGIDFKGSEQLLAAVKGGNVDAIRQEIQADELHYLSMKGLRRITGDPGNFCLACFNGKYAF